MFFSISASSGSGTVSFCCIGYCSLGAFGSIRVRVYFILLTAPQSGCLGGGFSFFTGTATTRRRCPVQRTDAPEINQTRQQEKHKNRDLDETHPADFTCRHGPGKEEESFHIEYDEEHGDQIELGRKTHAGAGLWDNAGFERFILGAAPIAAA